MTEFCIDCDELLTAEEQKYYEFRCEICERLLMTRLKNWREGKADTELDTMFNGANNSVH